MWKCYKYNGSLYEFEIFENKIILTIDEDLRIEKEREYTNAKQDMKLMVDKGMWELIERS